MSEPKVIRSLLTDPGQNAAGPRVLSQLDGRARDFESAVRRAVPILMRKGISLDPEPARLCKAAELTVGVTQPLYHIPMATDPGGSRAFIVFDAGAIAYLLEAALGGNLEDDNLGPVTEMTSAQKAAMSRVTDPIARLVSDAMFRLGIRLRKLPGESGLPKEGEFAVVTLAIGGNKERRVMIGVTRDALASLAGGVFPTGKRSDAASKMPAILSGVELDLVAELGRVRRRLSQIDVLRVGDVLRLDTPVRSPVFVRIQGRPILRVRPTTSGTQLAVHVLEKLEEPKVSAPEQVRGREIEAQFIESNREVPA
jgi:flagellar motor switch protein FliM